MAFFDKLKQGLDKGVSTVTVKAKEMSDASKVKSQISALERQKQTALQQLGVSVCSMLDGGGLDESRLREARGAIAALDDQIRTQNLELDRIHAEAQQALAGPPPTP